jgi:Sulfotransferase family
LTTAVGRTLDFLVIGAQRSGTTSLWRHLGSHPEIHLPPSKEAPLFCDDRLLARGMAWYLGEYFATADPGRRWGTVSPHYMMGSPDADVPEVARRIRAAVPDVKLIAILRDPIERAQSHHRMVVHRGRETRSFEEAALELLEPEMLERARREPPNVQPYLVQGEYGRILAAYLDLFPREQLHVQLTGSLEEDPARALRAIFAFLEVDDSHEPPEPHERHHRGGRARRLDPDAERELKDYLALEVWPKTPRAPEQQRAFNFWFTQWNVIPDERLSHVDPRVRELLEEHFAPDAELLETLIGLRVPWRAVRAPSAAPPPARVA